MAATNGRIGVKSRIVNRKWSPGIEVSEMTLCLTTGDGASHYIHLDELDTGDIFNISIDSISATGLTIDNWPLFAGFPG